MIDFILFWNNRVKPILKSHCCQMNQYEIWLEESNIILKCQIASFLFKWAYLFYWLEKHIFCLKFSDLIHEGQRFSELQRCSLRSHDRQIPGAWPPWSSLWSQEDSESTLCQSQLHQVVPTLFRLRVPRMPRRYPRVVPFDKTERGYGYAQQAD